MGYTTLCIDVIYRYLLLVCCKLFVNVWRGGRPPPLAGPRFSSGGWLNAFLFNSERRGGRVVECATLEMWYAARHREFESHPLRQELNPLAVPQGIGGSPPAERAGNPPPSA